LLILEAISAKLTLTIEVCEEVCEDKLLWFVVNGKLQFRQASAAYEWHEQVTNI